MEDERRKRNRGFTIDDLRFLISDLRLEERKAGFPLPRVFGGSKRGSILSTQFVKGGGSSSIPISGILEIDKKVEGGWRG